MFLYASIIMDCLELLSNPAEMREELIVMPKDLDAALGSLLPSPIM